MQDPLEQLEKMYLEEFLRSKGHTWESVNRLPADEHKRILTEASTYVALKLAEVESKARMIGEWHGMSKLD